MITTHVIPGLKRKRKYSSVVFMQDGASPHTAIATRELLEVKFSSRIISRFFPFSWPSHSPDLNVCDYFLWGYLKDKIFLPGRRYSSIDELKEAILRPFSDISNEMRQIAIDDIFSRAESCISANGKHFE